MKVITVNFFTRLLANLEKEIRHLTPANTHKEIDRLFKESLRDIVIHQRYVRK